MIGQELLFRLVRCKIARIITGHCSDGAAFHQQSVMIVLVCCCVAALLPSPRAWTRVAKWKAIIMGRDGPRGSREMKALHRRLSAVCGGTERT